MIVSPEKVSLGLPHHAQPRVLAPLFMVKTQIRLHKMFPRERDHTCDSHTTKDKSTQHRGNHRPKTAFLPSIFIKVALHESLARQTVEVAPSNGML
jgi:hypothetical protein